MTFDREQLIFDYALKVKDRLDSETIKSIVYNHVKEISHSDDEISERLNRMDVNEETSIVYNTTLINLREYSDDELISEVTEHNPELLVDVTVEEPSTTD